MKNIPDNLMTVGLVAAGVLVAGYAMYAFKDLDVISKIRDGFAKGL